MYYIDSQIRKYGFTITKIALTMARDTFLEGKTSCFTMSGGSDRLTKSGR